MAIWDYRNIKKNIIADEYITLDEAHTPVDTIEHNGNVIHIKREDKNPTGSWKDRGTAYKLTSLKVQGISECVIASSGNAAISLLTFANEVGSFRVHVVLSPHVTVEKKEIITGLIEKGNHYLYFDTKAKKKSTRIAIERSIPLLKTSIDQDVLVGYWSLGFEVAELLDDEKGQTYLFAPASSGTALVGLSQGLFSINEEEARMPRIYACQTQSCHPLVLNEDTQTSRELSLADAIVDQSMIRSPQLNKLINTTNGGSLAITNDELKIAHAFIASYSIDPLSYTSLLSIAAYLRMGELIVDSNVICIASGR